MAMSRMHSVLLLVLLHVALSRAQSRENPAHFKSYLINRILQGVEGDSMSEERLRTLSHILKLNFDNPSQERLELDGRQNSQSFQKAFINRLKSGGWNAGGTRDEGTRTGAYSGPEGFHKTLKGYHKSRDRGSHAVLSSGRRAMGSKSPVAGGDAFYQDNHPFSSSSRTHSQDSKFMIKGMSARVPWYLEKDPNLDDWSDNYINYPDENMVAEDNYYDPLDLSGYSYEHYDIEDLDYEEYIYYPHEEVCQTRKTWVLLNETINQRGQPVRVLPNTTDGSPQYVYVYKCKHDECKKCKGVHQNSRCVMRESFLKLYHELLDIEHFGVVKYDYVSVPTHCTCELLPDHFYHENCPERGKRKNQK